MTKYPLYTFQSSWIAFSFMVAVLSIPGVILSLIFSLDKVENLMAKSLFQKPTVPFLLAFGLVVELLAASTRAIRTEDMVVRGVVFGLVYMVASFVIAFYNKDKSASKYTVVAFITGLLLEIVVGYYAGLHRGSFILFILSPDYFQE